METYKGKFLPYICLHGFSHNFIKLRTRHSKTKILMHLGSVVDFCILNLERATCARLVGCLRAGARAVGVPNRYSSRSKI
jgi:hypothetical protein